MYKWHLIYQHTDMQINTTTNMQYSWAGRLQVIRTTGTYNMNYSDLKNYTFRNSGFRWVAGSRILLGYRIS